MDVTNCTGAHSPFEVDRILCRSKAQALTDKLWQTSLKWFKLLLPQTPCSTLLLGISASSAESAEGNVCPHLSCFVAKPTGSAQALGNASPSAELLERCRGAACADSAWGALISSGQVEQSTGKSDLAV